jgi:anti-anti-sigma factor
VDESNSGSFETWLRDHISMIERHKGVVVVDLADVLYLPSLGLRELSKALREARKRKVDIVLAGASVELRQIFRISNYDKLFRIFDDSEAAFRSLSESA